MKIYTPEEVVAADGKEGRQALVALDGKVYDLSPSKRWISGTHMNRHHAGMDLTKDISSAPHGIDVVSRFECVGLYENNADPKYEGFPKIVEVFLEHHPFFRRHPHPAIVHFPVAFLLVAPLLQLVAITVGSGQAGWSAFFCLVFGVLTIPVAILTGYFTWWINYGAVDSSIIRPKRRLAWAALGTGVVGCVLGAYGLTGPFHTSDLLLGVYLVTLLVLGVIVGLVGFLGGKLTFPYH
jgi:predicted heme/steroid binding protein/uncharacterized membrane protein